MCERNRHPSAVSLDDYLSSDKGIRACDPTTLGAPQRMRVYLENRIKCAYLEGYHDGERHVKENSP